jgi:hypothetical protein
MLSEIPLRGIHERRIAEYKKKQGPSKFSLSRNPNIGKTGGIFEDR